MRKLTDRASNVHGRYGVSGVLREGLDKAVMRGASLDVVHVTVLEPEHTRRQPVEPSFELRFLTPEDVERYSADRSNQIGAEFIDRARGGFDLCFGALEGDRLASYGWYALGSIEREHASGTSLGLPDDMAYLYKGFTHPDYRGRRLYPACMGTALGALRQRGIRRLVAFVYWSNEAALRSCERLGYRSLGLLVVGPRGPIRVPDAVRELGITFGANADTALAARRGAAPSAPADG